MERKGEERGLTRHVGVQAGQTTKHVYFHIIPRPRPDMLSLYSTARDVSTVMDHDQRVAAVVEGMRTGMSDDEGLEPSIMIKTALRKEILRLIRNGKIVEGDKEGELWSVTEGGKMGMRL